MTNPFLLTFKESLERVFPTPFFSPPLYEKTWDEISSYILVICFLTIFSPSSSRRKKGRVGRNGTLGAHTLRLSLFFCRVVYSSKIMNAVEKLQGNEVIEKMLAFFFKNNCISKNNNSSKQLFCTCSEQVCCNKPKTDFQFSLKNL